jgi:hypothetical protein
MIAHCYFVSKICIASRRKVMIGLTHAGQELESILHKIQGEGMNKGVMERYSWFVNVGWPRI